MLVGRYIQRDLLFVDELLVKPAGLPASQHRGGKVRLRITRLENGRGEPRLVHPRELHVVLNDGAALGSDRRGFGGDPRHIVAALEWAKILFHEFSGTLRLKVTHNSKAGIVGGVVQPEEIPHIFQLCGLDVLMRTHDVAVIRVALGIEQMEHSLFHDSIRRVFHALATLVAHDVLLVGKVGLIQLVGQIPHAVRFQPERQRQLVRWKSFVVVGAVEIGGAIDIARSRSFQKMEVRISRDVTRTFEHHVLEKMREACAAGQFVRRPYVVPQIDRHQRQPVVFGKDDVQAVLELVFFELQLRGFKRRGLGGRFLCLRRGRSLFCARRRGLRRGRLLRGGRDRENPKRRGSERQDTLRIGFHQSSFRLDTD